MIEENIVFKTEDIIVYHNGSGEVFIEHKRKNVCMRVSPNFDRIKVTASGGVLEPGSFNGLPCFIVKEHFHRPRVINQMSSVFIVWIDWGSEDSRIINIFNSFDKAKRFCEKATGREVSYGLGVFTDPMVFQPIEGDKVQRTFAFEEYEVH